MFAYVSECVGVCFIFKYNLSRNFTDRSQLLSNFVCVIMFIEFDSF